MFVLADTDSGNQQSIPYSIKKKYTTVLVHTVLYYIILLYLFHTCIIADNDVYQMLFNIGQLQFKHHPLFSVEHVLASHLIEISKKRDTVNRHQMIEHLRQKVFTNMCTHCIYQSLPMQSYCSFMLWNTQFII